MTAWIAVIVAIALGAIWRASRGGGGGRTSQIADNGDFGSATWVAAPIEGQHHHNDAGDCQAGSGWGDSGGGDCGGDGGGGGD